MNASFLEELKCPLTLEWLEDPVSSPCCGRLFSRAALQDHARISNVCPICRGLLLPPGFNLAAAPKNLNVAAMVESVRAMEQRGSTVVTGSGSVGLSAPVPPPASGTGTVPTASALPTSSVVPPPLPHLTTPSASSALVPSAPPAAWVEPVATSCSGTPTPVSTDPQWRCDIKQVVAPSGAPIGVGEMTLQCTWPSFAASNTQFIAVLDKSGSMAGSPFRQVKESMIYMLDATIAS